MQPIMSVDEARTIIGDDASGMTDEQVAKLVEDVDRLAEIALSVARKELGHKTRKEVING